MKLPPAALPRIRTGWSWRAPPRPNDCASKRFRRCRLSLSPLQNCRHRVGFGICSRCQSVSKSVHAEQPSSRHQSAQGWFCGRSPFKRQALCGRIHCSQASRYFHQRPKARAGGGVLRIAVGASIGNSPAHRPARRKPPSDCSGFQQRRPRHTR